MNKNLFKRSVIFFLLCFIMVNSSVASSISHMNITIYASDKSPKLNVKKKSMLKNQTFKIIVYRLKKNQTVVFSVKDPNIVSIIETKEKQCTIQALAVGKTKVIATIYKDDKKVKTLKCKITVTPPAVSVQFKVEEVDLEENTSMNLCTLTNLKPKDTAEVPVFTAEDNDVLRVSPNGFITGLKTGSVKVTATISNGKSDTITVNVVEASNEEDEG